MFEIVPHTADVRVRVAAASVEELFADAVRALMTVMGAETRPDATAIRRTVRIDSADRTSLLVDFLNEVLGIASIHGESLGDVRFCLLRETDLEAELVAIPAVFHDEIKAVTYHEAEVARNADGGWSTWLVFDI